MLTLTVYTTGAGCMRCTLTKKRLDAAGVPYTEIDVRTHPEALAYISDDLGYSEAPVCVVGDGTGQDHWSGLRLDHIERIARRLTTPTTA